jgi:transketolase
LAKHQPVPLEIVGILDTFAGSGSYKELVDKYGMGVSDIIKAAKKMLKRKNR